MKKTILQSLLLGSVPLIWSLNDNPEVKAETPDVTTSQPAISNNTAPTTQSTPVQATTAQESATTVTTAPDQNMVAQNQDQSASNDAPNAQPQQINPSTTSVKPSSNQPLAASSHLPKTRAANAGSISNPKKPQQATDAPSAEALNHYSNLFASNLTNDNAVNQTDFQLTQNATFNGQAINLAFSTAKALEDAAMQSYLERVFEDNRLASMKIFPNQNIKTFLTLTSSATGNSVSVGKTLSAPVKIEYYDANGTRIRPTKMLLDENGNGVMVGGSWTTSPIQISGYHWNNQLPTNANGHWDANFNLNALDAQGNLLVKYVYQANKRTASINFVDQATGQVLASKTLTGDYQTKADLAPVNQILTTFVARGYRVVSSNLPQNGFSFNGRDEPMVFTVIIALNDVNPPNLHRGTTTPTGLNPVVSAADVIGLQKTNLTLPDTYPQRSSKNNSTASDTGPIPPNRFNYHLFNLRPIHWRSIIHRSTPTASTLSPAVILNEISAFPSGGGNSPSQLGRYLASLSGNVNFGKTD